MKKTDILANCCLASSDADLAKLYNACCVELRRRASAATCDDLAIIRGNEMGKRALAVAIAGKHSILFIGPPDSGKSMLRAAAMHLGRTTAKHLGGPVTFEARPCPCGFFGSPTRACSCTASKIERHRAKVPVADITIEILPPTQRDLQGSPGMSSAELSHYWSDVSTYSSLELDEDGRNILKCACTKLHLSAYARECALAVARTIANMEQVERIETRHLCEAINYAYRMHNRD